MRISQPFYDGCVTKTEGVPFGTPSAAFRIYPDEFPGYTVLSISVFFDQLYMERISSPTFSS